MKYQAQVQLTPKLHFGKLQYYWHIDQITDSVGAFTVRHGYAEFLQGAYNDMFNASHGFVG